MRHLDLTDIEVLDFYEWLVEKDLDDESLVSLLESRERTEHYAEKYLKERKEISGEERYQYCKKWIKRYVNYALESEEFNERMRRCSRHELCGKDWDRCVREYWYELRYILYDGAICEIERWREERTDITPKQLADEFQTRINDSGWKKKNAFILGIMMDFPSKVDSSAVFDFMNWFVETEDAIKLDVCKIPKEEFIESLIEKYEQSRENRLNDKTKNQIIQCFNTNQENRVRRCFNIIFNKKSMENIGNIFQKYFEKKDKYKCVLLPTEDETELNNLFREKGRKLKRESKKYLDIYFGLSKLKDFGFDLRDKLDNFEIDDNILPCAVIWKDNLSDAKIVNITNLTEDDIFELLMEIIALIKNGDDLQKIKTEATEKAKELKKARKNAIIEELNKKILTTKNVIENSTKLDEEQKKFLSELLDQLFPCDKQGDNSKNVQSDNMGIINTLYTALGKIDRKTILDIIQGINAIANIIGIIDKIL